MAKEEKNIDEVAKLIYDASTIDEIKEAHKHLRNTPCDENLYRCLSDYATFKSVEIRRLKSSL